VIRRFERWMRQVLPPYPVCLIALGPVFGGMLLEFLVSSHIHGEWVNPFTGEQRLDIHPHQGILLGVAFAYGLWRAWGFHPYFRPKYREWLKTVAWDPSQQLPLGSPTLAWQDGVVLAMLGTLGGRWECLAAYGAAMLGGWSALLTAANFAARLDWLALAGGLALLPVALSEAFPWLAGMTLPAYLISAFGVKPSMRLFPWEHMPRWNAMNSTKVEQAGRPSDCWPLLRTDHLGDVEIAIAAGTALRLAIFAGAATFTFVAAANLDQHHRGWRELDTLPILATATLLMTAGRLLMYCGTCRPPISLAGRIATGRLIVPGYDQALTAPLLVLLIGFGGPTILWHWGAGNALSAGLTMFAIVAISLGMGPRLGRWQLTGKHRIVVRRPAGSQRWANSRGGA
jgi:hypothetical protein